MCPPVSGFDGWVAVERVRHGVTTGCMIAIPPLVLMHGLWDTPRLFRRLIRPSISRRGRCWRPISSGRVMSRCGSWSPNGPADPGVFGDDTVIDLFGFSMGV